MTHNVFRMFVHFDSPKKHTDRFIPFSFQTFISEDHDLCLAEFISIKFAGLMKFLVLFFLACAKNDIENLPGSQKHDAKHCDFILKYIVSIKNKHCKDMQVLCK